jgi:hypothetical protein
MSNAPICVACEANPLLDPTRVARRLCDDCAGLLGVVTMSPSTRPPNPCGRCDGRELIRAIARELSVRRAGEGFNEARHAPMSVTYEIIRKDRWLFAGKSVDDASPHGGRGLLEMYVCRACGFVEWYCANPAYVPIGPEYMTEMIVYPSQEQPYR